MGAGDLDHDGIPDLIAAAGPGGGPRVVVYSGKTGNQLSGPLGSFYAYDPAFTGGVFVASGDVDGDGYHDLITAAGAGGTPHVKVFSGNTGELIASFQAFDTGFRGGATVMAADFTGDGKAELVVGAGAGGGPNVRVFDLNTGNPLPPPLGSFYAFDPSFLGGVEVGTDVLTGDVTGDGAPDIVVGRGAGAGSLVRVFDGKTGAQVREFSPFGAGMTAGVRVATAFVDDDKYADIVVGTGEGVTGTVKVFSGLTGAELASPMSSYTPFGNAFIGGLFVAASNDPDQVLMYFTGGSATSGGSLSMTAEVWDGNQYNGLQQPTGTITFTTTVSGTPTTIGTATLVGYDTGKSRATLAIVGINLPVGMYSVKASYGGDGTFIPDFRNAQLQITAPEPILSVSLDPLIPINANNDNGSAWKPGLKFIPTKRDFDVTTGLTIADPQLKELSVTISGAYTGLLTVEAITTQGGGRVAFWQDSKKTNGFVSKQLVSGNSGGPVVIGGAGNTKTTFYVEGLHESWQTNDVGISVRFTPTAGVWTPGQPLWYSADSAITVTPFILASSVPTNNPKVVFANGKDGSNGLKTEPVNFTADVTIWRLA